MSINSTLGFYGWGHVHIRGDWGIGISAGFGFHRILPVSKNGIAIVQQTACHRSPLGDNDLLTKPHDALSEDSSWDLIATAGGASC